MTQAEYKRAPRTAGRRKLMILTSMVLLLCLACFGIGVMVGGSGSKQLDSNLERVSTTLPVAAPVTVTGRISSAGQFEVTQAHRTEKTLVEDQGAKITAESISEAQDKAAYAAERESRAERVAAAVEAVLVEKPVVRDIPLGSGINQRKTSDVNAGSKAEGEEPVVANSVAQGKAGERGTAGTVEVKPVKVAASAPAVVAQRTSGESYVVQVAAFRRDADAQSLAQKLKANFPVYVRQINLADKGQWFRVLVGPVPERTEADILKQKVKEKSGVEGFVKKYSDN